ncbi:hypothetical protein QG37_07149 [Candidozyma auris]|nr:hypothetical protein QG37_07149 [[Candida] auris]
MSLQMSSLSTSQVQIMSVPMMMKVMMKVMMSVPVVMLTTTMSSVVRPLSGTSEPTKVEMVEVRTPQNQL